MMIKNNHHKVEAQIEIKCLSENYSFHYLNIENCFGEFLTQRARYLHLSLNTWVHVKG